MAKTPALTFLERRELEARILDEPDELLVRRRLAELAVRFRRVERILAREAHRLHDRVRNLLDRHLLVLADGEDDRVDVVVVVQHPHEELPEVARVDELPQRLARAPHNEGRVVLCSEVAGPSRSQGRKGIQE